MLMMRIGRSTSPASLSLLEIAGAAGAGGAGGCAEATGDGRGGVDGVRRLGMPEGAAVLAVAGTLVAAAGGAAASGAALAASVAAPSVESSELAVSAPESPAVGAAGTVSSGILTERRDRLRAGVELASANGAAGLASVACPSETGGVGGVVDAGRGTESGRIGSS
jgi:hypothetical protein